MNSSKHRFSTRRSYYNLTREEINVLGKEFLAVQQQAQELFDAFAERYDCIIVNTQENISKWAFALNGTKGQVEEPAEKFSVHKVISFNALSIAIRTIIPLQINEKYQNKRTGDVFRVTGGDDNLYHYLFAIEVPYKHVLEDDLFVLQG